MHISDVLSRTFAKNRSEKHQQQQDASANEAGDMEIFAIEAGDMEIFAIEDMKHVDTLEFAKVTDQQFLEILEFTK